MSEPELHARGLKLLDLCCCAGGAGKGYADIGFNVTGVDILPQPAYPYTFVQADAVDYVREHGHEYDLIHTSPPCQTYSVLNAYNHGEYPDLIEAIREAVQATSKPYIIENVEGARSELQSPVVLCAHSSFDLLMYRHRLFETSFDVACTLTHYSHDVLCSRNGYLPTPGRPYMTITGGKHSRAWRRKACEVMGTPWMATIREVCEAIPPAYTSFIGLMYLWSLGLEVVA